MGSPVGIRVKGLDKADSDAHFIAVHLPLKDVDKLVISDGSG